MSPRERTFELALVFVQGVVNVESADRVVAVVGEFAPDASLPMTKLARLLEDLWWRGYDAQTRREVVKLARVSADTWREAVRAAIVVRLSELYVTGTMGRPVEVTS